MCLTGAYLGEHLQPRARVARSGHHHLRILNARPPVLIVLVGGDLLRGEVVPVQGVLQVEGYLPQVAGNLFAFLRRGIENALLKSDQI